MSDANNNVNAGCSSYAWPFLLAMLLHAVLLLPLLTATAPAGNPAPVPEPIVSYLYQPPPAVSSDIPQQPANETPAEADVVEPAPTDTASAVAEQRPASQPPIDAAPVSNMASKQQAQADIRAVAAPRPGLTQRALNQAATVNPAAVEQAAVASYQQLLQAQQRPKITVEKRHQQLSTDPAQQVFAQLDNGLQLIRTKGGCRFADPSKDGFDALMAANAVVPCGDEENSSALLQQALEKHIKR